MANQMTSNVRPVRCPRCKQVLLELADIPVYRCGGCGVILQAKKRKNDIREGDSCKDEAEKDQKSELEKSSDNKDTQSSTQVAMPPFTGELLLENNSRRDQNDLGDCRTVDYGDTNPCAGLSTELMHHDKEDSSSALRAEQEVDQDDQSLKIINERDQMEQGTSKGKLLGDINSTDEVAPTTKLDQHESEGLPQVAGNHNRKQHEDINHTDAVARLAEFVQQGSEEMSLAAGNYLGTPGDISCIDKIIPATEFVQQGTQELSLPTGNNNGNPPGHVNCTDEVASSTEFIEHESDELPLAVGNYQGKPPGDINFADEVAPSTKLDQHEEFSQVAGNCSLTVEVSPLTKLHLHVGEELSLAADPTEIGEHAQKDGRDPNVFGDCRTDCPGNVNSSSIISSSIGLSCQEIEDPSPTYGPMTELDQGSSSKNSFASVHRVSRESISNGNLIPPYRQLKEQPKASAHHGIASVSSIDTLDNIPHLKVGIALGDVSRSLTTRSNCAYEGSVSSYDGIDDQAPSHHLILPKIQLQEAVFIGTKALPRRDEIKLNTVASSYSKRPYRVRNCSSISSQRRHHAIEGNKWHPYDLAESTKHGHPVRSMKKFETVEHASRIPFFHSRGSQLGSDDGSPSNAGNNDFKCSSSFDALNEPQYAEDKEMELLKMISELQNQLKGMYIRKGKLNEKFPAGITTCRKHGAPCYDHTAQVKTYDDTNYSRHRRRCNHRKICPCQCQISRMAFSAEAPNSKHQVDPFYLQRCPQGWHCSAELPPCQICRNRGQYTAYNTQRYCNHCHSSPSSPQHYSGSDSSLWSSDGKSSDFWHKNHVTKKRIKEKLRSAMRHVRPVAGGAPFVVCYHCRELLQLPADFLLFKNRRFHQLRCSGCSYILRFSLENDNHILPLTKNDPGAAAPALSEVNNQSGATSGKRLVSMSHANGGS